MDTTGFLAAFGLVTILGILAGAATGLAPGLHVNNVAALVIATEAAWIGFLGTVLPTATESPGAGAVLLATFLVATAVSHAVFDFVPSVFFGAPSDEVAPAAVLPGHRMLRKGRGALAVALAARGAVLGAVLSIVLLVPLRLVLAPPVGLYDAFRPWTAPFVLGVLAALLAGELRRRRGRGARAAVVQALAALLGVAVLRGPSGLAPEVALLPLFSGLFGLPGLLLAARAQPSDLPRQRVEPLPRLGRSDAGPVLRGAFAGAAVSWLPGLSAGTSATLASLRRRGADTPSYMALLGSVSTSTAILSVGVLYVIGRARSGVAAAVRELVDPSGWPEATSVPGSLLVLGASAVLSAAVAAPASALVARSLARRWTTSSPRRVARAAIAGLLALVGGVAGAPGVLVLGLSALVGLVPVRASVRRVHLMASLLVPIALG